MKTEDALDCCEVLLDFITENRDFPNAKDALAHLITECRRLDTLVNIPHTQDWLDAVPLEAAHQIARWGTEHDAGKDPTDWIWLLGFLAGKVVHSAKSGDLEKAKHHTISSAAVLLNWHRHLSGTETTFRPGIRNPETKEAAAC